ncbi:protein GCY [Ophiobolus disseminans]|uniref:Protein GCY n=1 Tax=Ophiobolus disseminans TaxID=1469910 RepID=A0A6A7A9T5_9PLEO|nr:protein GCY [Ophiobolus disseminans]
MGVPSHFKLNTGASIPAIGLGTWKSEPGEVRKAVAFALKDGYRHIDAALIYGNEKEVGEGIRDSGIPRKDIFITSKLWNTHQDDAKAGLQRTLDDLGTDYLDLYLIHWPVRLVANETSDLLPTNPDGSRSVDRSWDQSKTWKQMEELYKSGKVKAVGVANWSVPYLEELSKTWTVVPAVNQVELHPLLPQHKLRKYCANKGILLEAYSPFGSTGAPIMSNADIKRIAEEKKVSPATILLSYHVNKGVVVLPKSVTESRISSNKNAVELSASEVEALDKLAEGGNAKRLNTPLWGFDLGFDDWYGAAKDT